MVVRHPDGALDIFGYSEDAFPPTDFHSATLVGETIVVIGSLSYFARRRPGVTPVYQVDTSGFVITETRTSGAAPGWIHRHSAELSDDARSIVIRGGQIDIGLPDHRLVENIDDWRLWLKEARWERLTHRQWPRWEVRRKDGQDNLKVRGVVVRFKEDDAAVGIRIEGELPPDIIEALTSELLEKMSLLENAPCELHRIEAF